jgi:predicted dehydrogenase
MDRLALGLVGCGGMGLRHVHGLSELYRYAGKTVDLVAVCDIQRSSADYVAAIAEQQLGLRPVIYTDYNAMLEQQRLDAVDITTDPVLHHRQALLAFDAGLHAAVEKPMAVTVRACQRMIARAAATKRVLSIFENYRRDPLNRLVKALLDGGVIGRPRLMVTVTTEGGPRAQQIAAWRHLKLHGGCLLEFTVHKADLMMQFLGPVDSVYAETAMFEQVRRNSDEAGRFTEYYRHRVRPEIERGTDFVPTAEDTALTVIRFASGALAQLCMSVAAPGERWHRDVIYGADGSIVLPRTRSGIAPELALNFGRSVNPLERLPEFRLNEATALFFGGRRRIDSYDLTFAEIDRKLLAIELLEFVDAVLNGRPLEVDGGEGIRSVALCYAILESGYARVPVAFADVLEDRVNAYQREINDAVGITAL